MGIGQYLIPQDVTKKIAQEFRKYGIKDDGKMFCGSGYVLFLMKFGISLTDYGTFYSKSDYDKLDRFVEKYCQKENEVEDNEIIFKECHAQVTRQEARQLRNYFKVCIENNLSLDEPEKSISEDGCFINLGKNE